MASVDPGEEDVPRVKSAEGSNGSVKRMQFKATMNSPPENKSLKTHNSSFKNDEKNTAGNLPPDKSSRGCYRRTLIELKLLIWKNLLLRKQNICCTCCQISCAPVYVALLVVLSLAFAKDPKPQGQRASGTGTGSGTGPGTGSARAQLGSGGGSGMNLSPYFREADLIAVLTKEIQGTTVAYSPTNSLTDQIIIKLKAQVDEQSVQWKGYTAEREIEDAAVQGKLSQSKSQIRVAIIFNDGFGGHNINPVGGLTISYKLRFTPDDLQLVSFVSSSTKPKSASSKLLGLQILLDKVIIAQLSSSNNAISTDTISVQGFSYPQQTRGGSGAKTRSSLKTTGGGAAAGGGGAKQTANRVEGFVMLLTICFCTIVTGVMREVVDEKASGVKELMRMMGLKTWMHWISWMIDSLLTHLISITLIVALLQIPVKVGYGITRRLIHAEVTFYWFLLFSYGVSATSFCFLISTFFNSPMFAMAAGIALWIMTSIVPNALQDNYNKMSLASKCAACLVPNLALGFSDKIITRYANEFDPQNKGTIPPSAGWDDLFSTIEPTDPLTLGHVLAAMYISSIIYCILTAYFENILPSTFGVRKPFYYPIMPSTWCHRKVGPQKPQGDKKRGSTKSMVQQAEINFEEEPQGIEKGVEIQHLRKVFGFGPFKKVAVEGLTLNMFHGQITALLGHNGAGKSTTMSLLTGMAAPTSGTASINGCDINNNMEGVRENLGFCPQENMLFNNLTVEQHLKFFGRLKRALTPSKYLREEIEEMLGKLNFQAKMYYRASKLSGGQKRKLQLAIALIGRSRVVILDEPSSGLDPEARRNIWNFLHEARKDRTIMLTTHHMDEADALADRIGIMSGGRLQCCGSAMFLKLRYGAGYTLKLMMELEPEGKPDRVLTIVQNHVNSAEFKSQTNGDSGMEMAMTLPTQADIRVASRFPQMFAELEQEKSNLGIKNISLGFTSMDDVFVRVDELHYKSKSVDNGKSKTEVAVKMQASEIAQNEELELGEGPGGGRELAPVTPVPGRPPQSQLKPCYQFCALLAKIGQYKRRRWGQLLFQIFVAILPIVVTIIATKSGESANTAKTTKTQLRSSGLSARTSLTDVQNPRVLLQSSNDQTINDLYKSAAAGRSGQLETVDNDADWDKALLSSGNSGKPKFIVGAKIQKFPNSTDIKITAMFSEEHNGADALAVNLATNTILKHTLPSQKYSIQLSLEELGGEGKGRQGGVASAGASAGTGTGGGGGGGKKAESGNAAIVILAALIFPIGFFLQGASFIVPPVEERLNQGKHLELMTGVGLISYWFSFFLVDLINVTVVSVICAVFLYLVPLQGYLVDLNAAGTFFLILLSFGFSAIWLSYLVSLNLSVGAGFSSLVIYYIFTGFAMFLFAMIDPTRGTGTAWVSEISTRAFPAMDIVNSLYHLMMTMLQNSACSPSAAIPCPYTSFLTWSSKDRLFSIGIKQLCFYTLCHGLLYMMLLFFLECSRSAICCASEPTKVILDPTDDDDVVTEKLRIQTLLKSGTVFDDAFVACNLRKYFGPMIAVSNITFGVHPGECFGLLGTNGAGKTTTFRMLSGDLTPSSGNAYLSSNRSRLVGKRSRFLRALGYCPQFDGIIGVLTGREMIRLYSMLRNVPHHKVTEHTNMLLAKSGLEKSADVQCRRYSGGMKRRLSTAMALAGDPPVVLMDEPTAGVDPVAGRAFWKIINDATAAGQSVILTSHSMEECEACCSRLGIMVGGKMRCLGTTSHLKKKFAQGYSLNIRLSVMLSGAPDAVDPPDVVELLKSVAQLFNPCNLRDKHQNFLEFHISDTSMTLAFLFGTAESVKERFGDLIVDYSLNETTLEDVFISFARNSK